MTAVTQSQDTTIHLSEEEVRGYLKWLDNPQGTKCVLFRQMHATGDVTTIIAPLVATKRNMRRFRNA